MWERVTSSNIEAVNYDPQTKDLHVLFVRGKHYLYSNVDVATYTELMKAPSKGRFLNGRIKGQFPFQELGSLVLTDAMVAGQTTATRKGRQKKATTVLLSKVRLSRLIPEPAIVF